MNRRSRLYRFGLMSGLGALVAAMALLAVPSQAARADTGCDCWIVTPTSANPATAPAGTSEVYSFTVTDDDPNETLETLTFTAPADFMITSATITSATGPTGTTPSELPAPSVTLTLPSDAASPFTVDITALAPCGPQGSQTWGALSDKDSLDTDEAIWSPSAPSVSITGQCSLEFTGEPAQTAINSDITTAVGSTGNPLAVQILDANGSPLNPADASANGTEVTVSIMANPGNGALSGSPNPVATSGGVASFANLQINQPGAGYTLAATATGFMSAASNSFSISQVVQLCGATCTASPPPTATTATSITTTSASGDFAALSVSSPTLTCNHYTAVSDMADFGIFTPSGSPVGTASAVATLTISASAVASSPRPLIFWQVCYGSPTPFPSIPGTGGTTVIGGITYHTGLLLSCIFFSPAHPEPCLISQRYTSEGAVQLKFVAFGDPVYRG
jgi:hypothetical protein